MNDIGALLAIEADDIEEGMEDAPEYSLVAARYKAAAKRIFELEDEIEKRMADDAMMQARIDELKEALEPFAEYGREAGMSLNDDKLRLGYNGTIVRDRDFARAARAAFSSDGGEDE